MNPLLLVVILTFCFEFVTLVARFVFRLSSKRVYVGLMKRFGFRRVVHIHHLFTGIFVVIIGFFVSWQLLLVVGFALICSDLMHHFLVLNFVVGSPEFHVVYKDQKSFVAEQRFESKRLNAFWSHLFHHV